MTRVLVAHASKYGSVEEVSRYIAAVLRDRGVACTVVTAREAEHVVDYDLVVLGTGLYMGRLHRDARRFLKRHHADLEDVPFAVFAMGPLSSEPEEKEKVRPQLDHALERYPGVDPRARAIFGGVIDAGEDVVPVQPHARGRLPRLGRDPRLRPGASDHGVGARVGR